MPYLELPVVVQIGTLTLSIVARISIDRQRPLVLRGDTISLGNTRTSGRRQPNSKYHSQEHEDGNEAKQARDVPLLH